MRNNDYKCIQLFSLTFIQVIITTVPVLIWMSNHMA